MSETSDLREWMLIFSGDRRSADRVLPYRVTQKVSARVVIVQAAAKEELLGLEGVRAVLEPGETVAEEIRGELTPSEALFVDAYAQRARPKVRPGDGLSWDAEGFLPPDPPKKP